ncbi:hypothetical protein EJ110_NYTH59760 [Nymphaea thermarum]|nr:hypothetical protein EJ110_NYTH59760 [Nymphaea thermarum]
MFVEPLVKVLKMVDGEGATMGYLYEALDRAKKAIKAASKDNKEKYMPYWKIIDRRWTRNLHNPVHAAVAFLNLFYFGIKWSKWMKKFVRSLPLEKTLVAGWERDDDDECRLMEDQGNVQFASAIPALPSGFPASPPSSRPAPPPSRLPAPPPSDVLAPPVSCSLCLSATVGGSCSRRRRLVPAAATASGSASYLCFRFVSEHLVVARLLVMAEEMVPKSDAAFDTGSAPKSENLPVQVTSIRLTKDNYLSWSAALEIGITSRGRLPYITGDKPTPNKSDPQWATWALEDSQVKVWIISSVSADIQPLILRKPTSFDMWTVLARMYGRKKRVLRTYQIKRSIYSLKQGDLSVAAFYAALKTKWEELDYHVSDDWKCGSDHSLYWEKEWMDRTFLFLGGLRDEFESIRSQILYCDEIPGIEEVYARGESEEQRRQVMHIDTSHGSAPSAFVSRASGTG